MKQAASTSPVRFLPSFTDVAFLLPVFLLLLKMDGLPGLLADGDTGWHLRTGEWILRNHQVPRHDLFSFTRPGEPWFAWEWLWDVLFGWIHQQFGLEMVALLSCLAISCTFVLVFVLARKLCRNSLIAIAVTALGMIGSSIHWLARPHLFTLLLTATFLLIAELVREGRRGLLWVLPGITVVWVNLHGGFFVGILILGAYAAGELAALVLESPATRRQDARGLALAYSLAGAACILASFINPYFYKLHGHILQFATDGFSLRHIDEFQSFDFHQTGAFQVEIMLGLGCAAAMWSFYRKRYAHGFLLVGWLHLGLYSARNLPIYMIVAIPAIALSLEELLVAAAGSALAHRVVSLAERFHRFSMELSSVDAVPRVPVLPIAFALGLLLLSYQPAPSSKLKAAYSPHFFPSAAVSVVRAAGPDARVFTGDTWGGYLIYRLYPNTRVFIDGRIDFYGPRLGQRYLDIMRVRPNWDNLLAEYRTDTVLLPVGEPLVGALSQSPRWQRVYADGVATVFRLRNHSGLAASPSGSGQQEISPAGSPVVGIRDRRITKDSEQEAS